MSVVEHRLAVKSIILLSSLAAAVASADEFYVASTGNDTNPGTSERPLATIECELEASRRSTGVDKIIVRPGAHYLTLRLPDAEPQIRRQLTCSTKFKI